MASKKRTLTDEGMLPAPGELPPFNPDDYASEAEANAALRARIGDAAFERMSGDLFKAPQGQSE